jgi:hypothetical protein
MDWIGVEMFSRLCQAQHDENQPDRHLAGFVYLLSSLSVLTSG